MLALVFSFESDTCYYRYCHFVKTNWDRSKWGGGGKKTWRKCNECKQKSKLYACRFIRWGMVSFGIDRKKLNYCDSKRKNNRRTKKKTKNVTKNTSRDIDRKKNWNFIVYGILFSPQHTFSVSWRSMWRICPDKTGFVALNSFSRYWQINKLVDFM